MESIRRRWFQRLSGNKLVLFKFGFSHLSGKFKCSCWLLPPLFLFQRPSSGRNKYFRILHENICICRIFVRKCGVFELDWIWIYLHGASKRHEGFLMVNFDFPMSNDVSFVNLKCNWYSLKTFLDNLKCIWKVSIGLFRQTIKKETWRVGFWLNSCPIFRWSCQSFCAMVCVAWLVLG